MFVKSFTHIITRSNNINRLASMSSAGASIQQQQQRTSIISGSVQQSGGATARQWMSSSPSEEQTSVVDTCRSKIVKALETEDVKVLGK